MTDQQHIPYDAAPMDPPRASEPVAAYQPVTQRPILADKSSVVTDEWQRPMTMDDIHRRIDEAEADLTAGHVVASQQVFAEMECKYPWLCE